MDPPLDYGVGTMTTDEEQGEIERRAREPENVGPLADADAERVEARPEVDSESPTVVVTGPTLDLQTKICPQCAEEVKAAARICRFCRFDFEPLPDGIDSGLTSGAQNTLPAATSSGTPDGSVPRSRASLAVELAQATQQWTLPQLLGRFDANRAGLGEIAATEAVMREHGYEPGSPVVDEQGRTNVAYTRAADRPTIVRIYRGRQQADAITAFQADAAELSKHGYAPTTQSWAQGQWGCGAFLVALLLCIVLVGFLVFIYLLVVKPEGTLTVTYEYRVHG